MDATNKIIDCPFCGSPAELWHSSTWDYEVRCTDANCKAKTRRYHENYTGAILAWNSRYEKTCKMEPHYSKTIDFYQCSNCGNAQTIMTNYCPNCGAKVVDR